MLSTGMIFFFRVLLKWCNLALYGVFLGFFLCLVLRKETLKGQIVAFKPTDHPLSKDLVLNLSMK